MKVTPIIFLLFLFGAACQKTTTVSGVVTNSSTGHSMEGVKVKLYIVKIGGPNEQDDIVARDENITNSKGEYALEVKACNSSYARLSIEEVDSGKYALPIRRIFDDGECRSINLSMNQYDAYLKLVFENHYSYQGNVYCYFSGPALEFHDQGANSSPRNVPLGQSSEEVFSMPSNAPIYVYWDTLKTSKGYYRGLDSITCIPNDTTTYIVRF